MNLMKSIAFFVETSFACATFPMPFALTKGEISFP